jgi:hypothetical protein
MRLTDRQISNLVRRIIKEDEDLDIKGTVMKTAGFEEEDIPQECIGGNPDMSEITEKSTKLNDSIKALSDMLNKAKSTASSMSESRRFRRY